MNETKIWNFVFRNINGSKYGVTIDCSKTDGNGHPRPVFECVPISGPWPMIEDIICSFVDVMEAIDMRWWYGDPSTVHQHHGMFEVRKPCGSKGQFYRVISTGSLNSTGKTGGFVCGNQVAFMDLVAAFMPQLDPEKLQQLGAMPRCCYASGPAIDRTKIRWSGQEWIGGSPKTAIYREAENGERVMVAWLCEELGKWLPPAIEEWHGDLVRSTDLEAFIRGKAESYRVLRHLSESDGDLHGITLEVPGGNYVALFGGRQPVFEGRVVESHSPFDDIL